MKTITMLTSEDDGYELHFSEDEMQEEACRLVAEYLGNDDSDYAGLAQDLSISENDLEGLLKLYVSNRKTFIERMEARAFVFWEEKILDNLIKRGE